MPSSPSPDASVDALPPNGDMIRPGVVLAGRYELVAPIGEGGMGVVWCARQLTTEKPVAIKLLRSDGAGDVARFLREAKVAGGLAHPNIVQVFDFWNTAADASGHSFVFMVMELLEGESLGSRIHAAGKLSYEETIELLLPVARALRFSHSKGVVHRDLKPDNVFLTETPDTATAARGAVDGAALITVKVLDFGLAKPITAAMDQAAMTQSGTVLGTPLYMAPEMVYGERVDVRADLWAIGVIAYECVVGCSPFEGENFGQIFRKIAHGACLPLRDAAPHVPLEFAELVMRLLSHEPADRPSAAELTDWLEREAMGIEPARRMPVATRSSRRSAPVTKTNMLPSPARADALPPVGHRSSIRAATFAASDMPEPAPRRFSPLALAGGFFFALIAASTVITLTGRSPGARIIEQPATTIEPPRAARVPEASASAFTTEAASAPVVSDAARAPAVSDAASARTPRTVTAASGARPVKHPKAVPPSAPKRPSAALDDPLSGGRF